MKKATAARKTAKPRRTTAAPKAAKPAKKPGFRLVQLLVKALDAKKADDLRVYDVGRVSSITDYLVLATATSDPHLRALRIEMEKVIDAEKVRILGIDTGQGSGWTVVDAFDVMVHLFTKESRDRYRLDLLWKDADEIPVGSLL